VTNLNIGSLQLHSPNKRLAPWEANPAVKSSKLQQANRGQQTPANFFTELYGRPRDTEIERPLIATFDYGVARSIARPEWWRFFLVTRAAVAPQRSAGKPRKMIETGGQMGRRYEVLNIFVSYDFILNYLTPWYVKQVNLKVPSTNMSSYLIIFLLNSNDPKANWQLRPHLYSYIGEKDGKQNWLTLS